VPLTREVCLIRGQPSKQASKLGCWVVVLVAGWSCWWLGGRAGGWV